jgi:hypothetical protein
MKLRRLFTKTFSASLFFTFIQQLIVASSTLWIIKLSEAAITGENIILWLTLFIGSLFIVYIPSSLASCFRSYAQFDAFQKYINCFQDAFQGQTRLLSNVELKNAKEPYFTNEAWLVIGESTRFISDWFSIILNVLCNITILGFALHKAFLVAYAATIPLVALCILSSARYIKELSSTAQGRRTQFMQILKPGWDSIITGNAWNINIWRERFRNAFGFARHSAFHSTLFLEVISTLAMIVSLIPVIGTLWVLLMQNLHNPTILAPLIATLPRQVLSIQYISDIVTYATHWHSLVAKLTGLETALERPHPLENYYGKINSHHISAERQQKNEIISSLEHLTSLSENFSPGRITIRGSNGSGKSCLLALIKEHFHDEAFLLPSHSELLFRATLDRTLSAGEKMLACLEEIQSNIKTRCILLDEWDANLDAENLQTVSQKIDSLAERYCVIEVRHRQH